MGVHQRTSDLARVLDRRAAESPHRTAYRFRRPGSDTRSLTYGALAAEVERRAAEMGSLAGRGERVALYLPPGPEYVVGFLACQRAGAVAVPVPPATSGRGGAADLARHPVIADAGARAAITADGLVAVDTPDRGGPAEELAFLQYTSGSTGAPKGVMVTHASLAANLEAIRTAMALDEDDRVLLWLPPYHDMGLIGGILAPLWTGIPVTLMPPQIFARDPMEWLRAVAEERATASGGPNFAYEACVARSTAAERAALDLSAWELAFIGSDPVRPRTLERFAAAFAGSGFRPGAFYPCYGLAETTLIATGGRRGAGAATVRDAGGTELVAAGTAVAGHRVAVVDPVSGAPAAAGETGEIRIAGPSVTAGYWNRPEATAAAFTADGWLRTGDLGFQRDGELYINGRATDMIVVRGRNVFPEDLEEAVRAGVPELAGSTAAAFGVDSGGEERIVVLAELPRGVRDPERCLELLDGVRAAVAEAARVRPHAVALVARGALPRTTSGKVRRSTARERYLSDGFAVVVEERVPEGLNGRTAPSGLVAHRALAGLAPERRAAAVAASLAAWLSSATGTAAERISGDTPLAACGLDSLTAAQLQGDIAARWAARIDLRELYGAATVAELAGLVADRIVDEPAAPRSASPAEAAAVPGATPSQAATWFLEQRHPGTTAHVLARAFRVEGRLDAGALRRTLDLLVARHPQLRTALVGRDGAPEARVTEAAAELRVAEASDWDPAEVDAALARTAAPFDLTRPPLLRAALLRRRDHDLLAVAAHHAAVDLWSATLLLAEFDTAYRAFAAGRTPELPAAAGWAPPPPAGGGEDDRRWWAAALAGGHRPTPLPAERHRTGPARLAAGAVVRELRLADPAAPRALAERHGTTTYTVLLAVLKAVLAGYGDGSDVVVGSPAAGRRDTAARSAVGFFANPLALRTRVAGDPRFDELLARVHATVLAALDHQDLPFASVVQAVGASRTDGRNPLYDVMFVFHSPPAFAGASAAAVAIGAPGRAVELAGLPARTLPLPPPDLPVDLAVEVGPTADGLVLVVRYAADLLDDAGAGAIADRYARCVEAVLADPALRLSALSGSGGPVAGTGRLAVAAPPADLVERVAATARRVPDAVAVRQGGHAVTYAALTAAAAAVAGKLREQGVGPETRVAVAAARTPELLAGLLGVLWAGGAYCPVDTAQPPARVRMLLAELRPALVLADADTAAAHLAGAAPVLRLDAARPGAGPLATPEPAHPAQLAYTLFTSGSTGRPKGVDLTRGGLAALADWGVSAFGRQELAGVLAGTPLTFDLSAFELLVPLAAGGTVLLAGHTLDLPRLPEREHATLVNTVPSLMAELLRDGLPASVRAVNLAGERLPAALAARIGDGVRLLNLYGPTEDTTYSTAARIDPRGPGIVSIGRPLPGGAAEVLGPQDRPADIGVPGELFLRGPGLARGYAHAPGRTAERFVPAAGGERRYRTGDLARRRPDGSLVFLGRDDDQVKLRGVRIEPGEVAAVLAECPGVREAAVAVHDPGSAGAALVGYTAGTATAEELRAFAAARLPAALVPARYAVLDRLPRTSTGKVDRGALRSLAPAAARPAPPRRAAPSATEAAVAEEWAALLDTGDPAGDEGFFAQGGHSLLAMRLLARVEERTGARVTLEEFLAAPTVAGLAAAVDAAPARGRLSAPVPPAAVDLPLTHTQERFWLLSSLDPDDPAYHLPAVLHLAGPLDPGRLERALRAAVARHDGMRLHFPLVDGVPRQRLAEPRPPRLPVTEVRDAAEADRIAREEARRRFDLAAGPLWRARLLRLGPDDHRLVFVAHHAGCDGWSLELLAEDLAAAYRADGPPTAPAGHYPSWAAAPPSAGEQGLAWWSERLAGLPALRLPADAPRRGAGRRPAATVRRTVDAGTVGALDELARAEGTTRFAALAALLAALLGAESGQEEFGIGTPVACRTSPESQRLFGCLANTVVLRADLTGRPGFRELLRRCGTEAAEALAHQDTPFAQVVKETAGSGTQAGTPLFQVMLAVERQAPEPELSGLRTRLEPLETGAAKFDLTVMVRPEPGGGLDVAFEYDAELFAAESAAALADRFLRLAAALVADPDAAAAGIDLVAEGERRLLAAWGDGGPAPAAGADGVHGAVLAQAARTPDRVAVAAPDGALSYAGLADAVRRVASALRAWGIGAEDRVAVCHERTSLLPVAVLGVLAAGAAYLPVRLADPAQRRAEMLADAGVRIVLADTETAGWLDTWDVPVLTVETALAAPPAPPAALAHPEQAAYVLYTSGSTGRPKGVVVTHSGVLARIGWAARAFSPTELSGVLAGTSIAFDFSVFELFGPLAAGGTAVLADSVLDLPELAERERVMCVTGVPSALAALAETAPPGDGGIAGWACGRVVASGGEALPEPLVRRLREAGAARVLNLYGPTEDSFCSTSAEVPAGAEPVPVGFPLPGSRQTVVNAGLTAVPVGVPGEILCQGVGVARGYLGRPGLTAAAFLPDPAGGPGARCYRSGDRARWTRRGLELIGRIDTQVKIRGHRVEVGEVEAAVAAVGGVVEAAVVPAEGPSGTRLAAWVRLGGSGTEIRDVRAAVRRRLPDYMVPALFSAVDELPRTRTGKVDRSALVRAAAVAERPAAAAEPPEPGMETELAALWREMLGVAVVGRHDGFFDLGGDSLLATRMTSRINGRFAVELPLRLVFEDDRLAAVARRVEQAAGAQRRSTRALPL